MLRCETSNQRRPLPHSYVTQFGDYFFALALKCGAAMQVAVVAGSSLCPGAREPMFWCRERRKRAPS